MSDRSIVCAGCGARYRLPDTFSARQVHCKKCGATIEVAVDAPAKATAREPRVVAAAPASRPTHAAGRSAAASASNRSSARPRTGQRVGSYADRVRQKEPGKLSPVYIISGVALVIIVGVLIVVFMNVGEKEPAPEPIKKSVESAQAPPPATEVPATPQLTSAELAKRELEQKEKEKAAAEPPKPAKPKVVRYKPQPLAFLPGTSEEMKTEINDLITTLTNLDLTRESKRAKERLVEIGQPVVPRLLTRLQEIKIDDDQEILVGSLINQALHDIAGDEVWEKVQYPVQGVDKATLKQRDAAIQRWFQWWMPIDEEKRGGAKPEESSSPK